MSRPLFSTSTSNVSNTFGGSGSGSPSLSNRLCDGSTRNRSKQYDCLASLPISLREQYIAYPGAAIACIIVPPSAHLRADLNYAKGQSSMTPGIHLLARCALAASLLFIFAHTQSSTTAAHARQQQQPEVSQELVSRIIELLQSASLPDRAWGAYLAQKNGLKQFAPNLIDSLTTLADDESPGAWLATSAVIDSLIQLEADVPASVILRLKPQFTAEKVILSARNPLANKDALLDL